MLGGVGKDRLLKGVDEAVVLVDAVRPTHRVRPAGCWAREDVALAV
jgi:hypothetical protein